VPLPVEKQVVLIYAGTRGFVDKLPLEALRDFEMELYRTLDEKHSSLLASIRDKRELTTEIEAELKKVLAEFSSKFVSSRA
jgi:F-type H+-transporting ATPase subunit alpha